MMESVLDRSLYWVPAKVVNQVYSIVIFHMDMFMTSTSGTLGALLLKPIVRLQGVRIVNKGQQF